MPGGNKMRHAIFLIAFAIVCAMQSVAVWAQPSVIVVRHGEKRDNSPDPILSAQGEARAKRLANLLAASNVTAIYTTEFKRTALHAAPTAKRFDLKPVVIAAKETDALLAKIRTHGKDDVVLVVGHSNTVPAILKGLGYLSPVTVGEADFDNLFIVALQPGGAPTVVHLKH
jgi:broad specificity phosphatase PhoE